MNQDFVVFGEDWGVHPSSTQHLIKRFILDSKVLWINSIGLRSPRLNKKDISRVFRKLQNMLGSNNLVNNTLPDNLTLVQAKVIPFPGNKLARMINSQLMTKSILNSMSKMEIEQPILWTSLPTAVDVIGKLNETVSIYYCGDDFSQLTGVDHDAVTRLESELVERVDLVLAASPSLVKKFPRHKTKYLPHGVDIDLFSSPTLRAIDLPRGKPIAGFYGSIEDWVDIKLLDQSARNLKDWNFVIIGDVKTDVSLLKKRENVFFLGRKKHEDLPRYIQHWQVSLLPFKNTGQIQACNPLKLREYLAAGKPIVSTDFPAVNEYSDLIHIATSSKGFSDSIQYAEFESKYFSDQSNILNKFNHWQDILDLQEFSKKRKETVTYQTWDARAKDIKRWLQEIEKQTNENGE